MTEGQTVLCADIGNSKIRFGFYREGRSFAGFSISARTHRLRDEYALLLDEFCLRQEIGRETVTGAILASVVPRLSGEISEAIKACFGVTPLSVGHGIRTGLDIRTDHQDEVGADIVANAVGARARLTPPFAVIDLGTATTLSVVDGAGRLLGVAIMPGLSASARALAESCAGLPEISLTAPKTLLGKNTPDSLTGGLIHGFAAMVDGMIGRVRRELDLPGLSLIACGGSAAKVLPYCSESITYDPDLTLDGLWRLWELNQKKK